MSEFFNQKKIRGNKNSDEVQIVPSAFIYWSTEYINKRHYYHKQAWSYGWNEKY